MRSDDCVIKLNLGCGIFYKPGYENIDKFESGIADKEVDILSLPYEDNSISVIEASHIVEHFDVTQLPFLLAEMFRVLEPGGELSIESPALFRLVIGLPFQSSKRKVSTLRFLFGVDVPGNVHKIGLTSTFLKNRLHSTGFKKIRRKRQTSYYDEKSFRIEAMKPQDVSQNKLNLITSFRWMVLKEFEECDTEFLESVENNCCKPLEAFLLKRGSMNISDITLLTACFSIIHPKLAKIYVSLLPSSITERISVNILDYLITINATSLFFSNWVNWKKSTNDFNLSLLEFYSHWNEKITRNLLENEFDETEFSYFKSLKPELRPFFSPEVIVLESLRLANQGLKAFSNADFEKARKHFSLSLKYNPSNVVASWNISRVLILQKESKEKILDYYEQTKQNITLGSLRRKVKKELKMYLENKISKINLKPLQLRY